MGVKSHQNENYYIFRRVVRALPALTVADDTPTSATGAVLVKQRSSRRVAMRPNRRGAGIDTVRQLYLIFLLMVVVIDTIVSSW